MKLQDVILKALAKKLSWVEAAEIAGVTERTMSRWREVARETLRLTPVFKGHARFYLPRLFGPVASSGMLAIQTFLSPFTLAAVTA
jgi:hypothetical protein